MKIYLELNTEGSPDPWEVEATRIEAQKIADKLGVTVQLHNGNYGSKCLEPKHEAK